MFGNYLKTAWRNLLKHRSFTLINISGLSIGITVCFIILMYVQDELGYDRHNENADRIFRVVFNANINGGKIYESNVMPPVAATLKKDFPEVEDATRLVTFGVPAISYNGKTFKEDRLALVDPNFFDVFTTRFLKGNRKAALSGTNSVIITETTSKKLFGENDPIGKFVEINKSPYQVSAVIQDIPRKSHYRFELFASTKAFPDAGSDSWLRSDFFTYLLLSPGSDWKKLDAKLPSIVKKYMRPQIAQQMGPQLAKLHENGNELGLRLQPLTSIHFHSHANYELEPPGNIAYVYIFSAVAIFMLLIAAINFINLSTARASTRAKEVGVRKVIGSERIQLVKQFMLESGLLVFFTLIVAVILIQLLLPVFNHFYNKDFELSLNPTVIVSLLTIGVVVTVISGLYPAIYLSSFKPVVVLKGKFRAGQKSIGFRSALVVFQFMISVFLIICTLTVGQQLRFVQQKKLGYEKDAVLVLSNSYALGNNERVYREMMMKDTRVINSTISSYKPAGPSNNNNALAYPQGHENEVMKTIEYHVDENYIPTMGMKIIAGRNFSPVLPTDSLGLVINESAARAFGWQPADAPGKIIIRQNSHRGQNIAFQVLGVVEDFNFKSLHEPITPLLMTLHPESGLIFKVNTSNVQALMSDMKKRWDSFSPEEPFHFEFLDDLYNRTYLAEQKAGSLLNLFSILTIIVACLGLFGLATYTAEQRTKEIGVRKVLGANVYQITQMLSKELLKLVVVACLIAFPLSYWAMTEWLQNFAYRIDFQWLMVLAASAGALSIALITVSFQTIRAAYANPVRTLRTE